MSDELDSSAERIHVTPSRRTARFKVRMADIDHFMATPGPLDLTFCQFLPPKFPVAKVPIVRVFGANEAGQKCCLHIHRAYPYFYIPYEDALDETSLNTYIQTLGLSLNRAATISYGGDPDNFRKSQYVAAIIPVKGIPFYGYHVGYSYFLKIYLFNPDNQTRIVDLMRGGAVMNRSFQPFEAHVPFRLQFCIDFNLYGMGWVEMESALFRNDVPHPYEGEHPKRWTLDTIVDENIWALDKCQTKISNCEIELDTTIDQIINRDRAPERNTHHTLDECFRTPPTQAQVPSMAGLWEDDAIRRRAKGLPLQELPKTQVREKDVIPWLNHDRALAMVADLVHDVMQQEMATPVPTFDTFRVRSDPETQPWMTAYEAVDALCPQPTPEGDMEGGESSQGFFDEGDSSVIVNEDVISKAVHSSGRENIDPKDVHGGGVEGIRGMDDIEADDEDHEFLGLPDEQEEFEGLDEEYLRNIMDQWEDLASEAAASSDSDAIGHVPDVADPASDRPSDIPSSSGVAPASSPPMIPQYDGGGDVDEDDDDDEFVDDSQLDDMRKRKKHQGNAEAEWQSQLRISGSKRSKFKLPPTSLPSSPSPSSSQSRSQRSKPSKPNRTDVSSLGPDISRTSQPSTLPSRTRSHFSIPRPLSSPSLSNNTSSASRARISQGSVATFPTFASTTPRKRLVPVVEIPARAKSSSEPTATSTHSRFLVNDDDDPIIDEDDSMEAMFLSDGFNALDESLSNELEQQAIASQQQRQKQKQEQQPEKTRENQQPRRLLELNFPAPVSPERQYFTSALDEMWSSPSPSPPNLSFFQAPPRAVSPTGVIQEESNLQDTEVAAMESVQQGEEEVDIILERPVSLDDALDESTTDAPPAKTTRSQPVESDEGSIPTSAPNSKRSRRVSWHPSPEEVIMYEVESAQHEDGQHGTELSSVVEETFIEGPNEDDALDPNHSTIYDDSIMKDVLKSAGSGETDRRKSRSMGCTGNSADPIERESSTTVMVEDSFEATRSEEIMLPSSLLTTPRWCVAAPLVPARINPTFQYNIPAPTADDLLSTLTSEHHLPHVVHQKPYFSNPADVPLRPKTFGGKEFRLESHSLPFLKPFVGGHNTALSSIAVDNMSDHHLMKSSAGGNRTCGTKFWEPIQRPPSYEETVAWLQSEEAEKIKARSVRVPSTPQQQQKISQLEAPTPKNPFGYKNSPTKVAGSAAIEKDHMDLFSLEVLCHTRGELLPDPKRDMILAIFYCWQTEREEFVSNGWDSGYRIGMITHADASLGRKVGLSVLGENAVKEAQNEKEMIDEAIRLVRDLDPDILVGYEIHNGSWGYLVDRYQALAGADLSKMVSRIHYHTVPTLTKRALEERNSYNSKHTSGLKIVGRHLFNVWRLIRSEVALTNYGFSNVVFHVLQQRIPSYTHQTLTTWWNSHLAIHQSRVIRYYLSMVQYSLQLIEVQELVSRTSEFARVFGVDFFSVISRGSQYKVESLMVRLAKPENYIMVSPSRDQVGAQRAAECLPMIMEPESGFYEDPVAVLDFQSLYPSVMIAYNYCYSTCLGKLGGGSRLGVVTDYVPQPGVLQLLKDHLHVAPNNVMYVNQEIRRGLLGRMLSEILETRVMVKKAMKDQPNDKSLLKLLEARQLGLKFIANVTYGYTSASYSGRMPGIEIADSIVHSARETLERAIQFVGENPKWRARVVYGDTDSMFVHLPGRSREEAFEIAYDIAETITKMNPKPVKLKFEKVYHGCFLVTKKRYVGASYEYPEQKEPIFDAKGIETIRRDGVPAVQKIMETCIKTMFRTQDLSQVKAYLLRQWSKILQGRCSIPDFMFGKEVRIGSYSENGVPPPGAIVSARRMEIDPRAEPQYKERVPYVVVYGEPGARLTDQVVEPKELLRNPELQLNGQYYISKQIIPSLERILQLAGADVKSWYESMPKVLRAPPALSLAGAGPPTMVASKGKRRKTEKNSEKVSAGSVPQKTAAAESFLPLGVIDSSNLFAAGAVSSTTDSSAAAPQQPEAAGSRPKPGAHRRRGGKGFVTLGPRIERFYQSVNCLVCEQRISSPHVSLKKSKSRSSLGSGPRSSAAIRASLSSILCSNCLSEQGQMATILELQGRLRRNERDFRATIDICSSCCRGPSLGGCGVKTPVADEKLPESQREAVVAATVTRTTGLELVACESIECPVFWRRRKEQHTFETLQSTAQRCLEKLEDLDRAEQYERLLQAEQDTFNARDAVQDHEEQPQLPEIEDGFDDNLIQAMLLGSAVPEAVSALEIQHAESVDPTEEEDGGGADSDAHPMA